MYCTSQVFLLSVTLSNILIYKYENIGKYNGEYSLGKWMSTKMAALGGSNTTPWTLEFALEANGLRIGPRVVLDIMQLVYSCPSVIELVKRSMRGQGSLAG